MKRLLASIVFTLLAGLAQAQPTSAPGCSVGGCSFSGAVTTSSTFNGWTPSFSVRDDSTQTPASGGTGNAVGDTLTLNDGCATHAVYAVRTVSAGAVTAMALTVKGVCSTVPANPVSVLSTTGTGSGATFTLSWAPIGAAIVGQSLVQGGNLYIGAEPFAGGLYGTENVFIGDRAGAAFTGNASFDVAVGHNACGNGGAAPYAGSNNTCLGTDAGRNMIAGSGVLAVGTGALKNLSTAGINAITAVGYASMLNLNNGNAANDSTAIGNASCQGAVGTASFRQVTCLGGDTGATLTTANNVLIVGRGVGNTVLTTGSGIVLIGSGLTTVTTPASGTTNWLNIENAIRASTTAPTVSSGFGTSPTIPAGTTSAGFQVNVGTGGAASSGVIAFATAAPNGWACHAVDGTNAATANTVATPTSTTTMTLTNYSRTTGALTAWAASDVLTVACNGF